MRLALDKQREYAARAARAAGADASATTLAARSARRRPADEAGIDGAARARRRAASERLAGIDAPEARAAARAVADYAGAARASGSSAATAGPTTSATAASTTCWPAGATSTCWCSTPRSTRTPAARCRRPRRAARWRSSRPAARRRAQEGPRPDGDDLRQRLRRAASRWAPTTRRRCKAFLEAEAYDGPSLIIAYSHCIAHGYDMRTASSSRSWRSTPATGRSTATTRGASPQGEPPLQLDSARAEASRSSEYMRNETRFRMVEQQRPGALPSGCCDRRPAGRRAARRALPAARRHRPCRRRRRNGRRRRLSHGPDDHLPRASSCRTRSCPAPRRWSTTSTRSAGWRTPAPRRS